MPSHRLFTSRAQISQKAQESLDRGGRAAWCIGANPERLSRRRGLPRQNWPGSRYGRQACPLQSEHEALDLEPMRRLEATRLLTQQYLPQYGRRHLILLQYFVMELLLTHASRIHHVPTHPHEHQPSDQVGGLVERGPRSVERAANFRLCVGALVSYAIYQHVHAVLSRDLAQMET